MFHLHRKNMVKFNSFIMAVRRLKKEMEESIIKKRERYNTCSFKLS